MVISPGKTHWSFLGGREGTFWGQTVNKWVRSHTLCTKTFEDQPLYSMFFQIVIQTREFCVEFQASFKRVVKHSFTCWGKITFKTNFWFKGRKWTRFFIFLLSIILRSIPCSSLLPFKLRRPFSSLTFCSIIHCAVTGGLQCEEPYKYFLLYSHPHHHSQFTSNPVPEPDLTSWNLILCF